MDTATHQYFRIRPLLLQKYLWDLEIQGDCIQLQSHDTTPRKKTEKKRGEVQHFSRRARKRLLEFVARVDWQRHRWGAFVSLTYPDGKWGKNHRDRGIQLRLFHRYMEKHLDRELPLLWRVEWETRKSGKYTGLLAPHFHLIYPTVRFVHKELIRDFWGSVLHDQCDKATRIDSLNDECKHSIYVAKYMSKVAWISGLGCVPYLSNKGRHYGYFRKKLFPMMEKRVYENLDAMFVAELRDLANGNVPGFYPDLSRGFSVFGRTKKAVLDYIRERVVDEGLRSC